MLEFVKGNLLEADVDALINTVNTVGVMGKGIALMFKEAYPENFREYAKSCKEGVVKTGKMFVTERNVLIGPRWIINFPTKQHWRNPSKMEWITEGLDDLIRVIRENNISSIAIPPLGSGNGGLNWNEVREKIVLAFEQLPDLKVVVYEPTKTYQNVAKRAGTEKLTPARALIAELVRRYLVLGIDCSLLEIQKLAWFLERIIEKMASENPLDLQFNANRYGPFANRLTHLLNALDGSYLHCDKRIADADKDEIIWFEDSKREHISCYLKESSNRAYLDALDKTEELIEGFQSPLGLEALATVDWLIAREKCGTDLAAIKEGLRNWKGGAGAGARKLRIFNDVLITISIKRLIKESYLSN